MAVLKKIKSATLIETLIATVLIVIVFMVASLVLNNLLLNSFSAKTHEVETRIRELEYNVQHGNIKTPYTEEFNNWRIVVKLQNERAGTWMVYRAENSKNHKEIVISRLYE
jgi:hypothetical protein